MLHRSSALRSAFFVIAGIFCISSATADLVISSIGTPAVITFDGTLVDVNENSYLGEGFNSTPSSGQLDSDSWELESGSDILPFGGSANFDSLFARGIGISNVGFEGVYSFDTGAGNRTLGIQPHVDHFSPGTITLRLRNGTGTTISSWDIGYDIFAFNDKIASTSVDFSYAVGTTVPGGFTTVSAVHFESDLLSDDTAVWESTTRSTTINATVVANSNLFLRWTINSTGSLSIHHDEIALDDISIVAAVPEPGAFVLVGLVCGVVSLAMAGRRIVDQKTTTEAE
jgi:hypothetical protein